jgi:hypothetical protein
MFYTIASKSRCSGASRRVGYLLCRDVIETGRVSVANAVYRNLTLC